MKQLFILLISLFISSFCYSQNNLIDVVYLKNGSMIRGIIIEQVPNQSLKIRTADGSVFVYNISDVEKMTREEPVVQERTYNRNNSRNYSRTITATPSNKTLRGYKGFIDMGYTFADEYEDRIEMSTSHGYQFNNYLFVGGGIAYHYYHDDETDLYTMPIFANFRANFMNKKVTPFTDVRVGYSVGDLEGGYAYVGLGARFKLVNKMALNLTLGFSYQEYEYGYYDDVTDTSGFNVKFGFEF
ncbi:porin family protein [Bacteroides sp. 51]|uniref:porin family protein n=1 Tax=Bacteroides sp. 51 TaxID=2302938 RepID=UPI0013D4BA8A|nr:porin family protein [Bacteroides sp. 51]NDV80560.1 hypothetical protein [Bacteroides sp. 51]